MKIIIAAVFYLLYWFICFLCTGTDKKNLAGLRSYPDEVQARVRREPQLAGSIPKAKSMPAILLSNLLLFTAVFSILGAALKNVLGLDGYWTQTEALGGDCCDYWYVGDKSPALADYRDLERI